jgi:small-conductance mechanosensitive channel
MTIDRVGGVTLAALALFVLEECYRVRLPLGTLQSPGPSYVPVLLASLLLGIAVLVVAFGRRSAPLASLAWTEWRHAAAIIAVCGFMALALERLGYRLTIFVALAALLRLLERQSWIATAAFAAGFALGSYYLFATLLRVPLPLGPGDF